MPEALPAAGFGAVDVRSLFAIAGVARPGPFAEAVLAVRAAEADGRRAAERGGMAMGRESIPVDLVTASQVQVHEHLCAPWCHQ